MPLIHSLGGTPSIPVDIADAVEVWARGRGRHARMEWHPVLNCPVIHFTSRQNADETSESLMLNEWDAEKGHHVPLNLGDYGASGIINLLERADTHSGRGEFKTLADAVQANIEHNARVREAHTKESEEIFREAAWLHRRTILGTPVVPGANFTKES